MSLNSFQMSFLNDVKTINSPLHQDILAMWKQDPDSDKKDTWDQWCGELIEQLATIVQGSVYTLQLL